MIAPVQYGDPVSWDNVRADAALVPDRSQGMYGRHPIREIWFYTRQGLKDQLK